MFAAVVFAAAAAEPDRICKVRGAKVTRNGVFLAAAAAAAFGCCCCCGTASIPAKRAGVFACVPRLLRRIHRFQRLWLSLVLCSMLLR